MGIVDATYKYFSDEKIPLSRKVKLTILVVIAAILIDNHFPQSYCNKLVSGGLLNETGVCKTAIQA